MSRRSAARSRYERPSAPSSAAAGLGFGRNGFFSRGAPPPCWLVSATGKQVVPLATLQLASLLGTRLHAPQLVQGAAWTAAACGSSVKPPTQTQKLRSLPCENLRSRGASARHCAHERWAAQAAGCAAPPPSRSAAHAAATIALLGCCAREVRTRVRAGRGVRRFAWRLRSNSPGQASPAWRRGCLPPSAPTWREDPPGFFMPAAVARVSARRSSCRRGNRPRQPVAVV